MSADLDLAPDRRQRLAVRGGPQVIHRAVERDIAPPVLDARKGSGSGVRHRVEEAAVDAAPNVAAVVGDLGLQHAPFLINGNDADPVVPDKSIGFVLDFFCIILYHSYRAPLLLGCASAKDHSRSARGLQGKFKRNHYRQREVRSPCAPFPLKSKATRRASRSRSSSLPFSLCV